LAPLGFTATAKHATRDIRSAQKKSGAISRAGLYFVLVLDSGVDCRC
jgi:hypothetical protein